MQAEGAASRTVTRTGNEVSGSENGEEKPKKRKRRKGVSEATSHAQDSADGIAVAIADGDGEESHDPLSMNPRERSERRNSVAKELKTLSLPNPRVGKTRTSLHEKSLRSPAMLLAHQTTQAQSRS